MPDAAMGIKHQGRNMDLPLLCWDKGAQMETSAHCTKFVENSYHRRVGLVIPPSAFLLDERVFASLGVLRVAAALEQANHTVSIVDLSGVQNYSGAFAEYLSRRSRNQQV
jgi:hypothetical protein